MKFIVSRQISGQGTRGICTWSCGGSSSLGPQGRGEVPQNDSPRTDGQSVAKGETRCVPETPWSLTDAP